MRLGEVPGSTGTLAWGERGTGACESQIAVDGAKRDRELLGDDAMGGATFDCGDDALPQIDGVGAHAGPPFVDDQHDTMSIQLHDALALALRDATAEA